MSTHNICFCWEIRNILCGYYLLSVAMYVPNQNLNQPAYLCSLIRVFVVSMKKLCILSYSKYAQWRFWSDCMKPWLSEFLLNAISKGPFFMSQLVIFELLQTENDFMTYKTIIYSDQPDLSTQFANIIIGLDKSGYQVNIFFLSLHKKHMLWYSLEVPHPGPSNYPHNYVFMEK